MIAIAEYNDNIEIYTDVESIEDHGGTISLTPGLEAGFERVTIIPNWQDIDLDVDDIESMIRSHIDKEKQRLRDERLESYENERE